MDFTFFLQAGNQASPKTQLDQVSGNIELILNAFKLAFLKI